MGPISNIPALAQIMAWHQSGDKPLSEPMMVSLLMHICITQPRWVNALYGMNCGHCQYPKVAAYTCFCPNHTPACYQMYWLEKARWQVSSLWCHNQTMWTFGLHLCFLFLIHQCLFMMLPVQKNKTVWLNWNIVLLMCEFIFMVPEKISNAKILSYFSCTIQTN